MWQTKHSLMTQCQHRGGVRSAAVQRSNVQPYNKAGKRNSLLLLGLRQLWTKELFQRPPDVVPRPAHRAVEAAEIQVDVHLKQLLGVVEHLIDRHTAMKGFLSDNVETDCNGRRGMCVLPRYPASLWPFSGEAAAPQRRCRQLGFCRLRASACCLMNRQAATKGTDLDNLTGRNERHW